MAKYVMVALNGPKPGGDGDALEEWYKSVHIPDLKAVEGVKTARRFKILNGKRVGGDLWQSVAIYEIETDDIDSLPQKLGEKLRPFHPDFDHAQSAYMVAELIAGDE